MFALKRQKRALLLTVTVTNQSTSSIYLPGTRDMCEKRCVYEGALRDLEAPHVLLLLTMQITFDTM